MLKVEIFKQETTVLLAATKLWLFYKKLPFSVPSSLSEQWHSNGHSPAWYLVFSWQIYSPWIAGGGKGVQSWPPCGWGGSWVGSAVSTTYKACWLQETGPCCSSDWWNWGLGGLGTPDPIGVVGCVCCELWVSWVSGGARTWWPQVSPFLSSRERQKAGNSSNCLFFAAISLISCISVMHHSRPVGMREVAGLWWPIDPVPWDKRKSKCSGSLIRILAEYALNFPG